MSHVQNLGNLFVNHPGEMSIMALACLSVGFAFAAYRCMMCGGKKNAQEVTSD